MFPIYCVSVPSTSIRSQMSDRRRENYVQGEKSKARRLFWGFCHGSFLKNCYLGNIFQHVISSIASLMSRLESARDTYENVLSSKPTINFRASKKAFRTDKKSEFENESWFKHFIPPTKTHRSRDRTALKAIQYEMVVIFQPFLTLRLTSSRYLDFHNRESDFFLQIFKAGERESSWLFCAGGKLIM